MNPTTIHLSTKSHHCDIELPYFLISTKSMNTKLVNYCQSPTGRRTESIGGLRRRDGAVAGLRPQQLLLLLGREGRALGCLLAGGLLLDQPCDGVQTPGRLHAVVLGHDRMTWNDGRCHRSRKREQLSVSQLIKIHVNA